MHPFSRLLALAMCAAQHVAPDAANVYVYYTTKKQCIRTVEAPVALQYIVVWPCDFCLAAVLVRSSSSGKMGPQSARLYRSTHTALHATVHYYVALFALLLAINSGNHLEEERTDLPTEVAHGCN